MYIYTTLFLASLVVAVVVLVLYRTVSNTSRSVYSSKVPIIITKKPGAGKGAKTARNAVAGSQPVKAASRATPQKLKQPYPAESLDRINIGWEGNRNRVGEAELCHAGSISVSRCSLYDVSAPDSALGNNENKQRVDWSFSENKRAKAANEHKAPRKAANAPSDPGASAKPWGW